jgi:tetratricopeptide (TPR) repeat protein
MSLVVFWLSGAERSAADPVADTEPGVKLVHSTIEVPTYRFGGSATTTPLFQSVEKGGVYPCTAMDWDTLSATPDPVKYEALTLENEHLRVTLLPELGGIETARRQFYRLLPAPGRHARRDYGLALCDFKEADIGQALEHLSSAVRRSPSDLAARKATAFALRAVGKGEGLFRAIAVARAGAGEEAAKWLREFARVNEQRKKDNSTELRTQAHYLAGIHEAFAGRDGEACKEFAKALEIDQSFFFAKQALDWLDAGLLKWLRK